MKQKIFITSLVLFWLIISYISISNLIKSASFSFDLINNKQVKQNITATNANTNIFLVKKVVDGDTIELEDGTKVRYIGVNTPETVDPRRPVQCFGKEASAENKKLVEGKKVRLEKDVSDKDKYGRLLRYVYIDNIFVNKYLVNEGFAQVSTYPPDVKYSSIFIEAEKEARKNSKGMWSSCKTD